MNYYISGQSGFIGQAITKYLTEGGDDVFRILRHASIEEMEIFFKENNPDVIFHLASYGNHFYQTDIGEMINCNIIRTYKLLETLKHYDYMLFYNISSSSVILPKQTPYSITKYCGEQLCSLYERTVNVRPFSVYGIGESKDKFIPRVIECLNTGEEMRVDEDATHDWIWIDDFINALFGGYTEIGTGIKTTNKEVILMLEDISGKKLTYTQSKPRDYDNDNWVCPVGVPSIGLYEGLKRVYEG